mgnify:CR=1 FL=1
MDLIEFEEKKEKAVLVCVDMGLYDAESSLDELEELARTAGAEVAARVTQKRDRPDTAYYIGTGRLDELKTFCEENNYQINGDYICEVLGICYEEVLWKPKEKSSRHKSYFRAKNLQCIR